MLKAKLVVVGGDAKAKEVDLRLPTVIGRGREVSLTLPHPLVSRRHTELFEKDGYLYVKDLGSLNGTYVNNRRIESEQRLAPNELLTLGNVTFRALYDTVENSDVIDDEICRSKAETDTKNSSEEKDETVNFERIDQRQENRVVENQARNPLKKSSKVMAKTAAGSLAQSDPAPSTIEMDDNSVCEENRSAGVVETPSDIFSGDEEFLTPEKSISLSSIESLPPVSPSISALGGSLDLGDQPLRTPIESVDLDIAGQPAANGANISDAELGSFLKKLPR